MGGLGDDQMWLYLSKKEVYEESKSLCSREILKHRGRTIIAMKNNEILY